MHDATKSAVEIPATDAPANCRSERSLEQLGLEQLYGEAKALAHACTYFRQHEAARLLRAAAEMLARTTQAGRSARSLPCASNSNRRERRAQKPPSGPCS